MTNNQRLMERKRAYLQESWGVLTDDTVATALGVTIKRCERLAYEMGIKRHDRIRTPYQLARLLHVHPNTVLSWIRKGLLDGQRSHVRSSKGRVCWHISDDALYVFLSRFPHYGACLPPITLEEAA